MPLPAVVCAFEPRSGLFSHDLGAVAGAAHTSPLLCGHCLSVQALAHYSARRTGDEARAGTSPINAAARACALQGPAGQWWWHITTWRTGAVVEPYPVYAVHQDGMGAHGMRALVEPAGATFVPKWSGACSGWASAPELAGQSLIADDASMIWRKVARREPRKSRAACRPSPAAWHPACACPGWTRF